MKTRLILLFCLFSLFFFETYAQIPIGAQVYIEPGQKPEQIEQWFSLLKGHGMTVCRIRMDETHMRTPEGFDFSLYDKAFDEAQKHGVAVFATIFPAEENSTDVGGFKFPYTETHHQQIQEFIKELVNHFKGHPALKVWVLQNEPGVRDMPTTPFTQKKFKEWKENLSDQPIYNGYMRKHVYEAEFLFEYTTWYLDWLAKEIRKYDQKTEFHVNNHMIFELLPEYDFESWQKFLDHLGASMHPSWHFGYFSRDQYPLAISANCNLIKHGAGKLPFWVTELQAGNNNVSSFNPFSPSPEEIQQWLLTSIFSGTEGIIFWTLNPRSVGYEAGEWSLVDFQSKPTQRLVAAGEITKLLEKYPDLTKAKPSSPDIHILYSRPAMAYQKFTELETTDYMHEVFDARKKGAHIKSVLGYYQALMRKGVTPGISSLEGFDWEKAKGTVILPNMIILPRKFYAGMKAFVKRGGTLLMTGQSGHLDEYQYNVLQEGWPLADLFGAVAKEFEVKENQFHLKNNQFTLTGHFLQGTLEPNSAKTIIQSEDKKVVGVTNKFGKGKAVWVPSILGLAEWKFDDGKLGDFVMDLSGKEVEATLSNNVFVHQLSSDQFQYKLIINTTGSSINISKNKLLEEGEVIFGKGYNSSSNLLINNGITVVRLKK